MTEKKKKPALFTDEWFAADIDPEPVYYRSVGLVKPKGTNFELFRAGLTGGLIASLLFVIMLISSMPNFNRNVASNICAALTPTGTQFTYGATTVTVDSNGEYTCHYYNLNKGVMEKYTYQKVIWDGSYKLSKVVE